MIFKSDKLDYLGGPRKEIFFDNFFRIGQGPSNVGKLNWNLLVFFSFIFSIGIFEFGSMLDLHARRVAVAKSWEPRGFEGVVTLENLYYTSNYQSAF